VTEPADEQPRCGRGDRCTAAEPLRPDQPDSPMIGAPTARPICPACETAVRHALGDAPGIWGELAGAALERGSAPPGRKRGKLIGSPLGFTLAPYHLAEQLHWWITAWADVVIYTASRPSPDRARQQPGAQVADACALLRAYLSVWVAHQPVEFQVARSNADPEDRRAEPSGETVVVALAGWQGCAWLLDWQHATENVLGKPPLIHYPPEPCPNCDQAGGLRRRDGTDKVKCVNCGKAWTMDRFEIFVHAWVGGAA
jgi:hypothetical protein